MTSTDFDVRGCADVNQMTDQLEVSLSIPDLGQAIDFYSRLLDGPPHAAERRVAWFDVPGSSLRLALREGAAPSVTSLRVCTETSRLRAASARLRRTGVRPAESGLMADGQPRA